MSDFGMLHCSAREFLEWPVWAGRVSMGDHGSQVCSVGSLRKADARAFVQTTEANQRLIGKLVLDAEH